MSRELKKFMRKYSRGRLSSSNRIRLIQSSRTINGPQIAKRMSMIIKMMTKR